MRSLSLYSQHPFPVQINSTHSFNTSITQILVSCFIYKLKGAPFNTFFPPLLSPTDTLEIATVTRMTGSSSTANALFLIAILITGTSLAARQAVPAGPVPVRPRRSPTATGPRGRGGTRSRSSLTMSPCSRGGVAAPAAPRTNRARLRAAPSPTETPREALTTRALPELLGTSLNQRHPMMRALKGAQMTAIRAELRPIF